MPMNRRVETRVGQARKSRPAGERVSRVLPGRTGSDAATKRVSISLPRSTSVVRMPASGGRFHFRDDLAEEIAGEIVCFPPANNR